MRKKSADGNRSVFNKQNSKCNITLLLVRPPLAYANIANVPNLIPDAT